MDKLPSGETPQMPIETFLTQTGLYAAVKYSGRASPHVGALLYREVRVDAYCVACQNHSVFVSAVQSPTRAPNYHPAQFFDRLFICSRDDKHQMLFSIHLEFDGPNDLKVTKIGQYPSIADIETHQIAKYRTILGAELYGELARAHGLAAHGIGIGSYVYLRRIFEKLIEEAEAAAKSSENWDQAIFDKARMDEKIGLLKSHLPSFLVDNKAMYGILSKGIHALSEDECRTHFPTLALGIELILDEKLALDEQRRKTAEAKKKIASLQQQLSSDRR